MDEAEYIQKQKEEEDRYEARCLRCGQCCGVGDGDLCVNLAKDKDDKYYCKDYEFRICQHVTLSGKHFICIPIRVFLEFNPPYPKCAYSKL